jgi:hypothetical protein
MTFISVVVPNFRTTANSRKYTPGGQLKIQWAETCISPQSFLTAENAKNTNEKDGRAHLSERSVLDLSNVGALGETRPAIPFAFFAV